MPEYWISWSNLVLLVMKNWVLAFGPPKLLLDHVLECLDWCWKAVRDLVELKFEVVNFIKYGLTLGICTKGWEHNSSTKHGNKVSQSSDLPNASIDFVNTKGVLSFSIYFSGTRALEAVEYCSPAFKSRGSYVNSGLFSPKVTVNKLTFLCNKEA